MRVREQLLQGASQIKLVGSGGVSTPRSPLDIGDLHRGRAARRRRGGARLDHLRHGARLHAAHHPARDRRRRGCIEHGHLMDEATAKLMADKGVWLSIQPFISEEDNGRCRRKPSRQGAQVRRRNGQRLQAGQEVSHQDGVRLGPAVLADAARRARASCSPISAAGTRRPRSCAWRPASNAELLALSGPRNPYPGKLGVVEEGAFADLLLVDGNPARRHRAARRPREEPRRHHEGRQGPQGIAEDLRREASNSARRRSPRSRSGGWSARSGR